MRCLLRLPLVAIDVDVGFSAVADHDVWFRSASGTGRPTDTATSRMLVHAIELAISPDCRSYHV